MSRLVHLINAKDACECLPNETPEGLCFFHPWIQQDFLQPNFNRSRIKLQVLYATRKGLRTLFSLSHRSLKAVWRFCSNAQKQGDEISLPAKASMLIFNKSNWLHTETLFAAGNQGKKSTRQTPLFLIVCLERNCNFTSWFLSLRHKRAWGKVARAVRINQTQLI